MIQLLMSQYQLDNVKIAFLWTLLSDETQRGGRYGGGRVGWR